MKPIKYNKFEKSPKSIEIGLPVKFEISEILKNHENCVFSSFRTFEGHLKKILEWIDNPNKFIEAFTAMNETEPLFEILKSKLIQT